MLLVGVAWGLIRLRDETLADIGLKRPRLMRTFMIGIGFAAIIFIAIYLSEKAGFRRDLSRFKDVQEIWSWRFSAFSMHLSAQAFTGNSCFRGFLCRASPCFSVPAAAPWIVACIVQGALFGAAHAYRILWAFAITGTLAC